MFQSLNPSLEPMLELYNILVTHRIESSSMKFEIHTIKILHFLFSGGMTLYSTPTLFLLAEGG